MASSKSYFFQGNTSFLVLCQNVVRDFFLKKYFLRQQDGGSVTSISINNSPKQDEKL